MSHSQRRSAPLLLVMGLATTTRETISGWGGPIFQIRLRNVDHALNFGELIGFIGQRKDRLVAELEPEQSAKKDYVFLPSDVWTELIPAGHRARKRDDACRYASTAASRACSRRRIFEETLDDRLGAALSYLFEQVGGKRRRRRPAHLRSVGAGERDLRRERHGEPQHHRADDGLRHHRHRARPGPGQVQEAGRRRLHADRQPDRAAGAEEPRLPARAGRGDHRVHRRARPRGQRPRPATRTLRGVRLRHGRARDQPDGPRPDDGGGPAAPVRRDQQDGQHAGERHRRGHREDLLRGLEARPEGAGHLPRQLQGRPAAVGRQEEARRGRRAAASPRRRPRRTSTGRSAGGCPGSGPPP